MGFVNLWNRVRTWLAEPGSRLSRRVMHGGVWAFLITVVNRGLQLVRTVFLARLLAPEDFGLFGITVLALSALERFTQTGFDAALIQKQEDTKGDLDTAWVVQIARGMMLGIILLASAPLVASFFEEPRAAALIRSLAAVSMLSGLKNIGVVYFRKEIEFHREFLYRLSSTLPDLVVSVIAALLLRNAWALVFGLLAGRFIQTAASYYIHPYRPSFRFDVERAKSLFDFGKYLTAQSIVLFLLTEGDDAFVGKVLGATSLGFYQIAYQLSNAAATQITHVISGVTFPAYSKLQDQPSKLNRGLLRTLSLTALLALPAAGCLGVLAPNITRVFLGNQWIPMIPAMQIMCGFGAMRAIAATFGPVYRAIVRVEIPLKVNTTQLIILSIIIYPMTARWNIVGTSVAITIAMAVAFIYTSLKISSVTGLSLRQLVRAILPPTVGTLLAIGVAFSLRWVELSVSPLAELGVLFAAGGLTYVTAVLVIYQITGRSVGQLRNLVTSLIKSSP